MNKLSGYRLLPLLAVLAWMQAQSQTDYSFEHITEADGLSDDRITCFFKDRVGYMWIGTENGLNRYDGNSFLIYNAGQASRKISNPFVTAVKQDSQGRLWVATRNGLNVIDIKNDSTTVFVPGSHGGRRNKGFIPSNLIWDIFIDSRGIIWIAADGRDLCCYDPEKGEFSYFPWLEYLLAIKDHRKGKYNSIRKLYYKSSEEIWLGTSAGLFSFNMITGKFSSHPSKEADHFISLEQKGDKTYFLQAPSEYVQAVKKDSFPVYYAFASSIRHKRRPERTDQRDLVWFPACKDLLEIDTRSGNTRIIKHESDNVHSLPAGNIHTVFSENAGPVWVGTDNGIGKFNPAINSFAFHRVIGHKDNLPYQQDLYRRKADIRHVLYSSLDDKYYACSPRFNCLYIIDRSSLHKDSITVADGVPLKNCSFIHEDTRGLLWILAGQHVFLYDRKTKEIKVVRSIVAGNQAQFSSLTEDRKGNIWIASFNEGLYRYNPASGYLRKFAASDSFKSLLPTCLYYNEQSNTLLTGTFDYGVYEYRDPGGDTGFFTKELMERSVISHYLINDIAKGIDDNIWIAAHSEGISILAGKGGMHFLRKIGIEDGLPDNNVYSLQKDAEGNMWAAHYKGLSKFDPKGGLLKNYDLRNGLYFKDLYNPLSITSRGSLLVPVEKGFVEFNPSDRCYTMPPFSVIINSVDVKNAGPVNDPGEKGRNVFGYKDNGIAFDLAALNYYYSSHTKYVYILEGLESNWNTSSLHQVSYSNLRPGDYVFKAKAVDFEGNASANEAVFSFTIRAPWWQKTWFIISASVLVALMICAMIVYRLKKIRDKMALQQQMAELKEQALRSQMNPHFIFNSLNAIQELIVSDKPMGAYQYLSKFSKLLRMVLDISERNFIPLSREMEVCNLYLELESLRFDHSFSYSVDAEEMDTSTTMFPTMLVQPFIENAIWHGLIPKKGPQCLQVKFEERDDLVICTVRDNGIGRERSMAARAGKIRLSHSRPRGIGLAMQRIQTLKATGIREASITISDDRDAYGDVNGTIVQILVSPETNQAI